MRACDGCVECCRMLGVKSLGKSSGVPCEHAFPGHGCARYDVRPPGCRDYACLWSLDEVGVPEQARPDRVGVLLDYAKRDSVFVQFSGVQPIVARETRPGAFEAPAGRALLEQLSAERIVIVHRGGKIRQLLGPDDQVRRALAFFDRLGAS